MLIQFSDGLLPGPGFLATVSSMTAVKIFRHVVIVEIAAGNESDAHALEVAGETRAEIRHRRICSCFEAPSCQ